MNRVGWIGLTTLTAALVLLPGRGCSHPEPTPAVSMRLIFYEEPLREAKSDDERWDILRSGLAEHAKLSENPKPVDEAMKELLSCPCRFSDLVLEVFPGVTKRLSWKTEDLPALAERIGSDYRQMGGGYVNEYQHVTCFSKMTAGEVSVTLLRLLTGETFSDKAAFDRWFAVNGRNLEWNAKEGRFFVKNGQTPTSQPVSLRDDRRPGRWRPDMDTAKGHERERAAE